MKSSVQVNKVCAVMRTLDMGVVVNLPEFGEIGMNDNFEVGPVLRQGESVLVNTASLCELSLNRFLKYASSISDEYFAELTANITLNHHAFKRFE